jgi:DNA anti-recombination protein RmuC
MNDVENTLSEKWLRLTDYASKYRISISTLRRRIKHGQLAYRFEEGKYLIIDEAPTFSETSPIHGATSSQAQVPNQSPITSAAATASAAAEAAPLIQQAQERLNQLRYAASIAPNTMGAGAEANNFSNAASNNDEPILSSASRLLTELKRAYTNILQEKEEQIIQLKEEVTDLKTLVRVLEDDNERMRRILKSPSSYGPAN